jgi:hypothetical protein
MADPTGAGKMKKTTLTAVAIAVLVAAGGGFLGQKQSINRRDRNPLSVKYFTGTIL